MSLNLCLVVESDYASINQAIGIVKCENIITYLLFMYIYSSISGGLFALHSNYNSKLLITISLCNKRLHTIPSYLL